MPNPCRTCQHPQVGEINVRLVRGGSVRALAAEYGLHHKSVERHARSHVPKVLRSAQQAVEMTEGDRLLAELRELHETTREIIRDTLAVRHPRPTAYDPDPEPIQPSNPHRLVALKAIEAARRNIELLLRVAGELDERSDQLRRMRRHG